VPCERREWRLTLDALEDLKRLQALLIDEDPTAAARALDAIETAFELLLYSLFSCRKAWPGDRASPVRGRLPLSPKDRLPASSTTL